MRTLMAAGLALALCAGLGGGVATARWRQPSRAPVATRPADPVLVNRVYGYRLTYPGGWQAEDLMGALGKGLARSPDVLLYADPQRKLEVAMGVKVCAQVGAEAVLCLPSGSRAAERATTVAGRPARQYDLHRELRREDLSWRERHTLVEHRGRTIDIWCAWPESGPWRERMQALCAQTLRSFTFIPAAGGSS